jgi:hypothetical protein
MFFSKVRGANATPREKERYDLPKIMRCCWFATGQARRARAVRAPGVGRGSSAEIGGIPEWPRRSGCRRDSGTGSTVVPKSTSRCLRDVDQRLRASKSLRFDPPISPSGSESSSKNLFSIISNPEEKALTRVQSRTTYTAMWSPTDLSKLEKTP